MFRYPMENTFTTKSMTVIHRFILFCLAGMLAIAGRGQSVASAPAPLAITTGNYRVGAFMCPLWNMHERAGMWDPVKKYPEREPILGYYHEGDTSVTDWEIKFALEHGIS